MTEIISNFDDIIARKINKILSQGGVVAFPTETVYALAVDASNDEAVKKVYALKGREICKPLSLLVPDMYQASQIVDINEKAEKLSLIFFPGPLTIVLNKKNICNLSSYVNAQSDKIGIRIPSHLLSLKILKNYGRPLVGTSANISGNNIDSTDPELVIKNFKDIDLILDFGKTEYQNFSTVVDVSGEKTIILREGVIPANKIFKCLGESSEAYYQKVNL